MLNHGEGVQGVPGKFYDGRGWFQLSYPCNYDAAGKNLGLDLLNNPNLVSQRQDVAVKIAIWFYQTNNMDGPARQGNFAATTRIINGQQECDGGPGDASQQTRVATYKRIRQCFGLGQPQYNPIHVNFSIFLSLNKILNYIISISKLALTVNTEYPGRSKRHRLSSENGP